MNLLGLDFLLTSDGILIPVDLNKVPRINRMTNISKILARSFTSKQGISVIASPLRKPNQPLSLNSDKQSISGFPTA